MLLKNCQFTKDRRTHFCFLLSLSIVLSLISVGNQSINIFISKLRPGSTPLLIDLFHFDLGFPFIAEDIYISIAHVTAHLILDESAQAEHALAHIGTARAQEVAHGFVQAKHEPQSLVIRLRAALQPPVPLNFIFIPFRSSRHISELSLPLIACFSGLLESGTGLG